VKKHLLTREKDKRASVTLRIPKLNMSGSSAAVTTITIATACFISLLSAAAYPQT
jgi:hypothetical protein